jgi:hypothetical protein
VSSPPYKSPRDQVASQRLESGDRAEDDGYQVDLQVVHCPA